MHKCVELDDVKGKLESKNYVFGLCAGKSEKVHMTNYNKKKVLIVI